MRNMLRASITLALAFGVLAGCGKDSPLEHRPQSALPGNEPPSVSQSPQPGAAAPYDEAETVAEGLRAPWDLAFAPDGRLFVTERPGAIRVIEQGKLLSEPLFSFDDKPVASRGESGLLGLALDPAFASNKYMYVYHTYEEDRALKNRVLRLIVDGNQAKLDRVLLDGLPGQQTHDGGRIRFGPDGLLYVTVGDAQVRDQSQQSDSLAGKILRIRSDGTIPADNPDPSSPIYSLGHRNPQGLAWQPGTGTLYSSEHGQSAKDEINVIVKGGNYGWPLIEGDQTEPAQSSLSGTILRRPLIHSGNETWAPSGMTFVTQGPWSGALLVANLRGTQVLKLTLNDGKEPTVKQLEALWKGEYGRIRHIAEGPDGSLYMLTNNTDGRGSPKTGDDRLLRFKLQ